MHMREQGLIASSSPQSPNLPASTHWHAGFRAHCTCRPVLAWPVARLQCMRAQQQGQPHAATWLETVAWHILDDPHRPH